MKKKVAKKLSVCALVCIFAACFAAGASAAVLNEDAEGSVTLTLSYDGEAVTDGSFALYQAGSASWDLESGGYVFKLTSEFSGAVSGYDNNIIPVEDLTASELKELSEALASYAEENGIDALAEKENSSGTVTFSGLENGLYLVVQTKESEGFESIGSFLISVPMYDEDSDEYVYEVNAAGKFVLTPEEEKTTEEETEEETPEEETEGETPEEETTGTGGAEETTGSEESTGSGSGESTGSEGSEGEEEASEEPEETLAQTGQLNWPIYVLAAVGVALIAAGLIIRKKFKA